MFYLKGVKMSHLIGVKMSNVLFCTLLMQCIVGVHSKEYKSVFCWKCRKCSIVKFAAARILLVKTAAVKTNSVVCVLETWQRQNVANCLQRVAFSLPSLLWPLCSSSQQQIIGIIMRLIRIYPKRTNNSWKRKMSKLPN